MHADTVLLDPRRMTWRQFETFAERLFGGSAEARRIRRRHSHVGDVTVYLMPVRQHLRRGGAHHTEAWYVVQVGEYLFPVAQPSDELN